MIVSCVAYYGVSGFVLGVENNVLIYDQASPYLFYRLVTKIPIRLNYKYAFIFRNILSSHLLPK